MSCAARGQGSALASLLTFGGGVTLAMADAPLTGGALIGEGMAGLMAVDGCDRARGAFLAGAGAQ